MSRVQVVRFRASNAGCGVWGFEVRIWSLGFRGLCLRVLGFGFRISGFGFRVQVLGFRFQGVEITPATSAVVKEGMSAQGDSIAGVPADDCEHERGG